MYLVFAGSRHSPKGGARDMLGSFGNLSDAKQAAQLQVEIGSGWCHILDTFLDRIVAGYEDGVDEELVDYKLEEHTCLN